MSSGSNIEWTDATWNPVTGCTRVSAGCDHCYAVTMTHRLDAMEEKRGVPEGGGKYRGLTVLNPRGERHFNGKVKCHEEELSIPLSWTRPRRVFVNSMSDLFHERVPFEFIDRVFAVMARTPRHTYQVLTKRPERMAEYFSRPGIEIDALTNVWLGTSCENQAAADERIPHLLKCPAAVTFISAEPLLGEIDLTGAHRAAILARQRTGMGYTEACRVSTLDWVIVGGESGANSRPCNVAWIRSLVEQCGAAGVPCFVKQLGRRVMCRNDQVADWLDACDLSLDDIDTSAVTMQGDPVRVMLRNPKGGDMAEWPEDLRVREFPKEMQ